MAGRSPRCGPAQVQVTPLAGGHRTAAYSGRRVRPRYMQTMPAAGRGSTAGRRRRWAGRRGTGKGRSPMCDYTGGVSGADAAASHNMLRPRAGGRQWSCTGSGSGAAAPARAGAERAAALVENQARTQASRSYTLNTAEALAEDQSQRSGSTSEDWAWRGGTGGGPGPMDIEEARRRSHEPTAMRPELGLG